MRTIKNTTTRTVEIEFNQGELDDLAKARIMYREASKGKDLDPNLMKALENGIYLISTVLGNHQ